MKDHDFKVGEISYEFGFLRLFRGTYPGSSVFINPDSIVMVEPESDGDGSLLTINAPYWDESKLRVKHLPAQVIEAVHVAKIYNNEMGC